MKKFILTILTVAVVLVGGFVIAEKWVKGGAKYYVQITDKGERVEEKTASGGLFVNYRYHVNGYDEKGKTKELTFDSVEARPLKLQAYLKVTWNQKKGVTGWEEVKKDQVPQKALSKLEKEGK